MLSGMKKKLSEIVGTKQEDFIPCPAYLHLPIEDISTIAEDEELIIFRYFYHSDGDVLIPIRRNSTGSLIVKH